MPTDDSTPHERPLPLDPDVEVDEGADGSPVPVQLTWHLIALVAIGGAAGTASRHVLGDALGAVRDFPLGTFLINVVGAFVLGLLLEGLARNGHDAGHRRRLRLLIGTGFLGGFTTYSALAVDTDLLLRGDHLALAAVYAVGTVAAGLVAAVAGIAAARKVVRA